MRKKTRHTLRTSMVMPDKTVLFLSYAAAALFVLYIACVLVTVYFATEQTALAATMRETEGSITSLEQKYYEGVAVISGSDPRGAGYVTPTDVVYSEVRTSLGLTFAGK